MRAILTFVALATAVPAHAEWYQASSRHFLIYSEQKPAALRRFAEKLERFDRAARSVREAPELPVSKGNRLTIFVLPSSKDVQRLANDKTGFIDGFYRARGAGSVAFVPRRVDDETDSDVSGVLLHEYSHHLMFQDFESPYPQWLVEGFAEFMAAARFERNGTVGIGLPAVQRSYSLLQGQSLPLESLLADRYDQTSLNDELRESIYARGWLMTHYFTFEPTRRKQFLSYLRGIAKGVDPLESAKAAFGDLKKLDRDLNSYLRQSTMHYLRIPASSLNPGPIEVSALSAGAGAAVPILAELRNDPPANVAAALASRLRTVEAKFPGDAFVETALAEGELAAGNSPAAVAAADSALRADPQSTDAMILRGRASVELLVANASATPVKFEEARSWFLRANKIDPEDPEPLYEFYHSFVQEGAQPTKNAIDALHYASDLAPQDLGLRITSAGLYVLDGDLRKARVALVPIAYDPHGGQTSAIARRMIARIDAGDANGALREGGWTMRRVPAH